MTTLSSNQRALAKKRRQDKRDKDPGQESGVSYLSAHQRQQIVQAQISASYSGPLPPPDILIRYNEAVPGAAERIIAMAEEQSTHRMALENRVVDADIRRSNLGLIAGVVVALGFGAGSFVAIIAGQPVAGAIIGGVDLVALVGTFVYGTERRRSERLQRARELGPQEE